MEEEFNNKQIDADIRWVLKEDLMCQILLYTRNSDTLFYNQLIEQKRNQQKFRDVDRRLIQLERLVSVYIQNRNTLRMISSAQLHIDNADKIDARETEIADIVERFQKSNVLFLQGRSGIGKTTLARLYARACAGEDVQVYLVKYENSIEYTVGKLIENPDKSSGQQVLHYWYNLRESERRKVLLIIDNFNEDALQGRGKEHFNRELRGDFYKKLVDSGIQILFTTRIDVGRDVYVVKPVKAAYEMFLRYSGAEAERNESIIREIITVVKGNTLLIVLIASIWERIDENGKRELLNRLKGCRLKEQTEVTTVYADIDDVVEDMTIYDQVGELLDFSGILSDVDVHKVFANAALLPHEGMSKFMFQKMSGCKDDNSLYKLIRNAWILREDDYVYVHPVVREIAFRNNLVTFEMCAGYCKSVNEEIQIELPLEKRFIYKKYAEEIYRRFVHEEVLDITLVNLFYRLSAIYDGLAEAKASMEIINRIYSDIEKVVDNPVDKARMLSGIAFSLNNCFEGMETLEQAKQLLDKAMKIVGEEDKAPDKLRYVQAYGRILSNYGSNALAKSKCEIDKKMLHLEEALKWHRNALAYRENALLDLAEEKERQTIIGEIATSYTTIATDYFHMGQYAKAIEHHQKSFELRAELGLENEKYINSQRIIGCILSLYEEELAVDLEYISLALSYYPEILQENYKVCAFNAMKDNLGYFVKLVDILISDGKFANLVEEARARQTALLGWIQKEEQLVEMFSIEMEALKRDIYPNSVSCEGYVMQKRNKGKSQVERDLYLRKVALGEIEGELTGYASIDKPWLKYYTEEHIKAELPHMTAYEYLKQMNIGRLDFQAIDSEAGNYTYKELFGMIDKTAASLYKMGTCKGKIVLTMLPVLPHETFLFYGVDAVGAAMCQLPPQSITEDVCNAIKKYDSEIFFVFGYLLTTEMEQAIYENTSLKNIIVIGVTTVQGCDARTISWEDFIKEGEGLTLPEIHRNPRDLLFLASTGGSTGEPKSVMLNDDSFNFAVHQYLNSELDYRERDRWIRLWPVFSATAVVSNSHLPLCAGMNSILRQFPLNMDEFDQMIMQVKPQHLMLIPQLLDVLEKSELIKEKDLAFIKTVGCGGLGITRQFEERVEQFLKAHDIHTFLGYGWGCTENATSAAMRSSFETTHVGSVGAPLVNTIVSVFDCEDETEMTYDEEGEICINSPTIMMGYFKDEELTNKVIRKHADGSVWLHTGDLGTIDKDGIVTVKGRMTRMLFVFPTAKVYPQSLESAISKVDGVREVAICGIPDSEHDGFQVPVCFIVPDVEYTSEQVIANVEAYCEEAFPEHARPKKIFIKDAMPLTKVGKPDIRALEAELIEN
ncbi:MAG: AMP-binding protein [Lachnospiraceae bacterium]|nr:AMP-binding protein [Lachnospiraceae bacterium]